MTLLVLFFEVICERKRNNFDLKAEFHQNCLYFEGIRPAASSSMDVMTLHDSQFWLFRSWNTLTVALVSQSVAVTAIILDQIKFRPAAAGAPSTVKYNSWLFVLTPACFSNTKIDKFWKVYFEGNTPVCAICVWN